MIALTLGTSVQEPAAPSREAWAPADTSNISNLYSEAGWLAEDGKYDEATRLYVWLWNNIREYAPSMTGVRGSLMANEMAELAEAHPPARAAFDNLRDDARERMTGEYAVDRQSFGDWVTLNKLLGNEDETLRWFDENRDDPRMTLAWAGGRYEIEQMLIERGRFADIAVMYPFPLTTVGFESRSLRYSIERFPDHPEFDKWPRSTFYADRVSHCYAALLAAGRDDEAEQVIAVTLVFEELPDVREAMIAKALGLGAARPVHREILAELEQNGEDVAQLRRRLEAALDGE